ncbi:hypothetical protein P7C70_g8719, partial [Phenoliferia sp. Uapishka_3]
APVAFPSKPSPAPLVAPVIAPTPPAPVSAPTPVSRTHTPAPATPAPWVKDEDANEKPSLSLRQIQEIEARQTEARKASEKQAASRAQALAAVQAAQRAAAAEADTLPSSSTWATMSPSASSQGKAQVKAAPWIAAKVPVAAGKTLKEIQEEEEKRKKAAALAAAAANPSNGQSGAQPRGYAASAKTAAPGAPWVTIPSKPAATSTGPAAPKPVIPGGPVRVASTIAVPTKPVVRAQPPAPMIRPTPTPAAPIYDAETPPPPSSEFMKWTRDALKGLTVPMDEFIQMLLSFPLDASADVLEIVSDSVYANSSTLDGRRFANEFSSRRRLDVAARYPSIVFRTKSTIPSGKPTSMAEALRQQAAPKPSEWNVKVAGGKKKKGGK